MVDPSHHIGCCNSSVGNPASPLAEARAPTKHQQVDLTARHDKNGQGKKSWYWYTSRRGRLTLPVAVVVLALALAAPLGALAQEDDSVGAAEDGEGGSGWDLVLQLVLVAVLVAASGLFSGLTLGLLGLDKIGLEIISHGDEPQMAAFAKVGVVFIRHHVAF